jgi:hypothetical protein
MTFEEHFCIMNNGDEHLGYNNILSSAILSHAGSLQLLLPYQFEYNRDTYMKQ